MAKSQAQKLGLGSGTAERARKQLKNRGNKLDQQMEKYGLRPAKKKKAKAK